jgi:hypothetical protein
VLQSRDLRLAHLGATQNSSPINTVTTTTTTPIHHSFVYTTTSGPWQLQHGGADVAARETSSPLASSSGATAEV